MSASGSGPGRSPTRRGRPLPRRLPALGAAARSAPGRRSRAARRRASRARRSARRRAPRRARPAARRPRSLRPPTAYRRGRPFGIADGSGSKRSSTGRAGSERDQLGDPRDRLLRAVGEEAEGHVQRLRRASAAAPGRRAPSPASAAMPVAHPVGQVERDEQARPRALQPLLGHPPNATRLAAREPRRRVREAPRVRTGSDPRSPRPRPSSARGARRRSVGLPGLKI